MLSTKETHAIEEGVEVGGVKEERHVLPSHIDSEGLSVLRQDD